MGFRFQTTSFIQSTQAWDNSSSVGFAHEIHHPTTKSDNSHIDFHFGIHLVGKAHVTACCNGNFALPSSNGGSLRTYANILYIAGSVPVRFSRNGKALFHYSKILYELDV